MELANARILLPPGTIGPPYGPNPSTVLGRQSSAHAASNSLAAVACEDHLWPCAIRRAARVSPELHWPPLSVSLKRATNLRVRQVRRRRPVALLDRWIRRQRRGV